MYAHSPLPGEHYSQASFVQAHTWKSNHISFRILPGTQLAPGWRVANVDQCLAKKDISAAAGLEPWTLWSTVRWHIHSTMTPLKGLGNIIQMRENGAKVVTSMLDVQLKIIWQFELKQLGKKKKKNWEKLIWSIP